MAERYVLMVDEREAFAVSPDPESQRALWLLIRQRTAIRRVAAQLLLNDGKMIIGSGLIVAREDTLARRFGKRRRKPALSAEPEAGK